MDYNYETDNGAILLPNFIPYIRFLPNPVQNDNTTDLGVDSIDAMDYDYELDTYDTDFPGEKYLLEYVVYDANPVQSDDTTDVKISSSVDAAAASLQLGTNNEETQAIEISSSEVTTTIYGPVSMINILNASSIELTSNLNVSGQTTLMNVSTQALTATSFNCDTITSTTPTGTMTIGSTGNTLTTINGGQIKQIIPLPGGVTRNMEIINGQNGDNTPSLGITFNRKYTTILTALPCYRIGAPSSATTGYFEIVVSGSNTGTDGYCYKGIFAMSKPSGVLIPSSVSTLFSFGGTTTISFVNIDAFTIDLYVLTSGGSEQNFITTLTAYPTASPVFPGGLYYDYTAVTL